MSCVVEVSRVQDRSPVVCKRFRFQDKGKPQKEYLSRRHYIKILRLILAWRDYDPKL